MMPSETSDSMLYDEDILLWSEEQAEIIRRLGRTRRDLPNELDIENVAEEIESVGRSELAAVQSQIQNILVHLVKLAVEPESGAARHWRVEIAAFHGEVRRRYAPSMHHRIHFDQLWTLARELAVLGADQPEVIEGFLPRRAPFGLDDMLHDRIDGPRLAEAILNSGGQGEAETGG
jgi:hypothetical protein